jgi:hypothetical protein
MLTSRRATAARKALTKPPAWWDKFTLYEVAVTNAPALAEFFNSLAPRARTLREDFSGTAALARAFLARDPAHRAIAVDHDRAVTSRIPKSPQLTTITSDVRRCKLRSDIIAATNFAAGYYHTRPALIAYLRHARACLSPSGLFICDMYAGSSAFVADEQRVVVRVPKELGSGTFVYIWEQRIVDITTALVHNAIHFELPRPKRTPLVIQDAFTYHWRIWSPAELRDAMLEAGFKRVDIYDRIGDAIDQHGNLYTRPLTQGDEIDDPAVIYFAAKK